MFMTPIIIISNIIDSNFESMGKELYNRKNIWTQLRIIFKFFELLNNNSFSGN